MKSPIYILTALLPIAVQVAVAAPSAEPADDLEERGNGGGHGGHGGDRGHDREHDRDYCVVKKPYSYHKYPCMSSGIVGESKVGDKFQPVCKYQDWYQNSKGWWVQEGYKPYRCEVNPPQCS
ncbi:hypothetical protein PENANT_c020G00327 [Penicillium antarcticum]|uniref:Ig-like domain-containing protein n=1 Tax=Penicillium antarcticum TaxID=416450 RepID=A0A1V6Q0D1_9EURO|nr:uncharacterized protein N7508_004369 [Penicillium antarcticum]KAJ5308990.1 hypothetical protein N7508_004369 [Penicillium antarcticum]OQD82689.1 hypothetical protein PENANT_c020G00327 [Penicillium antarcticum]